MNTTEQFFAPCPRGLETVLALELKALGAEAVKAVKGGVGFRGPFSICYTINLESRIASRVLWRVGYAHYSSEKDIYEAACGVGWCDWFDASRTIRVNVSAIRSPLQSEENGHAHTSKEHSLSSGSRAERPVTLPL